MSILNNLAIIFAGSDGSTADNISSVIGKGKTKDEIIEKYVSLIKYYKVFKDSDLGHIYYKSLLLSDEQLNSSFDKVLQKFDTDYKQLGFADDIIKDVNHFVSSKTNNQISNIITKNDIISKEESITIVDALYVDHEWDNPFTSKSSFTFSEPPFEPNCVRENPAMSRLTENEEWNLTEGENWKCLGIPYKGRKTWLHILLPNKDSGFNELIKNFDAKILKQCIAKKVVGKMKIIIPAFEIENKISLNQILAKLGINQTGIKKPFYKYLTREEREKLAEEQGYETCSYEEWVQSEIVDENEEKIEEFIADHPFIYFITLVKDSVEDLKSIVAMGKFC
uniref:Serpin domain-containing protein n=1 Tax=Panagrolaimus davidi TaxID=227884 RepID=A0A914Q5Y1_9BILA